MESSIQTSWPVGVISKTEFASLHPLSETAQQASHRAFGILVDPFAAHAVLAYGSEYSTSRGVLNEADRIDPNVIMSCAASILPLLHPERYRYVVGLAFIHRDGVGEYLPHAWNLNHEGRIVEIGNEEPTEYFGIEIPRPTILAAMCAAITDKSPMPNLISQRGRRLLAQMGVSLEQAVRGDMYTT